MNENAQLKMKSVQIDGDDVSEVELTTECFYKFDNDMVEITYEESEATGFQGSTTCVAFNGSDSASIVRNGKYESNLLLETEKKHFCHYGTPFGSFVIGINTSKIKNNLTACGGDAYVKYSIDMNSSILSHNEIFFNITLSR